MIEIEITTDFIKLDSFLKLAGAASTGGQAKLLVLDGLVEVGGRICLERGKKLVKGDVVSAGGQSFKVR